MSNPQNLTQAETAKILRVGGSSLAKARSWKTGPLAALPFIKFGRSVRYRLSDLEAFMDSHRIDPAAEPEAAQ
jgi:hypothetical protein